MSDAVQLFALTPGREEPLVQLDLGAGATTAHQGFEQLGNSTGVYTGLRTFHGNRFVGIEEHLDRTERSMGLLGWSAPFGDWDRQRIRRALATIAESRREDCMIRIDVLPPGSRVQDLDSHVVFTVAPLKPVPESFREEGVKVEVTRELSRQQPKVKAAEFVLRRHPYPLGKQESFEHIMLDEEDRLLEATSANFYSVFDGVVYTAGSGVLEGITRILCRRVADAAGIEVREDLVPLSRLTEAEETFLSSSTRGIVPIVAVGGTTIGTGRPGPVTRKLMAGLQGYYTEHAELAWPAGATTDAG